MPSSPSGGNLAIGDEIVVYGTIQEFPTTSGTTEIDGPDGIQSTDDIVIRRLSAGNAVPIDIVTPSQLNWLPASSQGEKYEGGLVRIQGPFKVGRIAGPGIQSPNYLLTTVSFSTDSVLVDALALDLSAPEAAPPVGAIVESVQGIVNQATTNSINSYRIQLRNQDDIVTYPSLKDAYAIEDNQIRLVFDRNLDQGTAENESNYYPGPPMSVDSAVMPSVPGNVVVLTIINPFSDGASGTIDVRNVGAANCASCTRPQSRSFVSGVMTCAEIQAPDGNYLQVFQDRSRFAGSGLQDGPTVTFRGIMVHQFGIGAYLMDEVSQVRGGLVVSTTPPLLPSHRYRITGHVAFEAAQDETGIVKPVEIVDEGTGTIPNPIVQTVATLRDATTDLHGSILTGEDYEGMLVRLQSVKCTVNRSPGQPFFVTTLSPSTDTLLISSGAYTAKPDSNELLNVQGILRFSSGSFRISPRSNADIESLGVATPVPWNSLWQAATGLYPNSSCPWVLFDTAPEAPVLSPSFLTLETSGGPEYLYYEQTQFLAIPDTLRIKTRLRVISETHLPWEGPNSRRGVGIEFAVAPDSANFLFVGRDTVFLWSGFEQQGPTAFVDTDNALHTYEIRVVHRSAVTVFQDDVQILTGVIVDTDGIVTEPTISWGDITGSSSAVSQWSYVVHNANTTACGTAPLGVPSGSWANGSSNPLISLIPYPNPARGPVTFAIRAVAGQSEPAWVRIYDVSGRIVKSMKIEPVMQGLTNLAWDGNDDRGRAVSSGTYLLRLEAAGGRHSSIKATILR